MSDPLDTLAAPADVVAALRKLRDDLKQAAGANLAGLVLYGGVARGRYHAGRSDINLVVLLREASADALAAIAPALRQAWHAIRVEPFLLTPAEVARSADAFPTKFFDIRDRHLVLLGENPFAGLAVAREHVRLRIEQELQRLPPWFRAARGSTDEKGSPRAPPRPSWFRLFAIPFAGCPSGTARPRSETPSASGRHCAWRSTDTGKANAHRPASVRL